MADPTPVVTDFTFTLRMSFTFATLRIPQPKSRRRIIDRELADIAAAFEYLEFGPTMDEESVRIRVVEAAPHVVHRVTQETKLIVPNAKKANDQIRSIQSVNWRADSINVQFVHSIATVDGGGLRGLTISPVIARRPNGILALASMASHNNLAHELGHFLLNTRPGIDDHVFDDPENLMSYPIVPEKEPVLEPSQVDRMVRQLRKDPFLKGVIAKE